MRGGPIGRRQLMYLLRFALLAAALVAALVFHARGRTLGVLHVARIGLLIALVAFGAAGRGRARRGRPPPP